MGIRQLRTLIAVADGGSFSAASEALFMTQSAVSMQMKALEDESRLTLFDRKKRSPVLNADGWLLAEEARALVERYENLRLLVTTASAGVSGSVRLGVVPSVATGLLPRAMALLREVHPAPAGRTPDVQAA